MKINRPSLLLHSAFYTNHCYDAAGYLCKELELGSPSFIRERRPEHVLERMAIRLHASYKEAVELIVKTDELSDSEDRIKYLEEWLNQHGQSYK